MIKHLRLFYFYKNGTTILNDAGNVLKGTASNDPTITNPIVESFFYDHANNCNNDQNIQNFRFQNTYTQIIPNTLHSFGTIEDFETHSQMIADKLGNSLTNSTMRNDFYLVIFSTKLDDRNCLCIFRMEANTGIQVTDEITLKTLEKMLPDKKSRLQKAAIIFEHETKEFSLGNETEGNERNCIHSKIIDRVDPGISGYFFRNFLDSYRVIDKPETSAKNAIEAITEGVVPYLNDEVDKREIEAMLRKDLSVQKSTSYRSLVGVVSSKLNNTKLEDNKLDVDGLADRIYEQAKSRNNTVVPSFEARYQFPPKVKITDIHDTGEISISFYAALRDWGYITWGPDKFDENYSILRIDNSLIKDNLN
ncbi:nucleoid-associated protein [Lactococcus lactis]|uniref:nucleoid-associated protein n=1 Tax=Lactococcus lactis TaxID=1358 RepID=UPI003F8674C9